MMYVYSVVLWVAEDSAVPAAGTVAYARTVVSSVRAALRFSEWSLVSLKGREGCVVVVAHEARPQAL